MRLRRHELDPGLIFNVLTGIFFAASTITLVPGRLDGDELFCFWGLVFLIMASAFCPPKRKVNMVLPTIFFGLVFAMMLARFEYMPLRTNAINAIVGVVSFRVIAERIRLDFFEKCRPFMLGFLVATGIMLAAQLRGFSSIWSRGFEDYGVAGFSTTPWIMGSTAALMMPFCGWLGYLVAGPAYYFSHSTAAILGTAAGLFVRVVKDRRLLIAFAALAPVAIALWILQDGGVENHRFTVWRNTWKFTEGRELLGRGFGAWAHMGFIHRNGMPFDWWRWAHNEFYQVYFELGAAGLLVLGLWLGRLFIFCTSRTTRAALATLCVLSFFNPVMHFGRLIVFGILILAVAEAEASERRS